MKVIHILSLSALFLSVAATPVGNADVSPTDRPATLPRNQIPAGALVFGLDENPVTLETDDSPARMTKRDDCKGSSLCGTATNGQECQNASNHYISDAWYCGYTSRVSGHCTAIFTCKNYHGTCWAGWFLKASFNELYSVVGCHICGSRYFDSGNCRATYNYCLTCKNSG